MYVSNVIVFDAARMSLSIAPKIWSPFTSVSTRLPSRSAGPSSTPIAAEN
jgi:hypothetical protein